MGRRLVLPLSFVLAGCFGQTNTDKLDTEKIWGDFSVTVDESAQGRATVTLFAGAPLSFTFVKLGDGDSLTISEGGSPVELQEQGLPFWGPVWYSAELGPVSEESTWTFDLYVDSEDAHNTAVVSVPPALDLTAPQGAVSFSRSEDDVELAWTPSGMTDSMRVTADYTACDGTEAADSGAEGLPAPQIISITGDTGSHTLAAGTITGPEDAGASCSGSLSIGRHRSGQRPDDFLYGSAGATQLRSLPATFEP